MTKIIYNRFGTLDSLECESFEQAKDTAKSIYEDGSAFIIALVDNHTVYLPEVSVLDVAQEELNKRALEQLRSMGINPSRPNSIKKINLDD